MKTLGDITHLENVKVFLRVDFNLPIRNGMVTDDFRIHATLPTIKFFRTHGARIIIASHLEVLEGEKATLAPVSEALKNVGVPVTLVSDYKKAYDLSEKMQPGDCILLENL